MSEAQSALNTLAEIQRLCIKQWSVNNIAASQARVDTTDWIDIPTVSVDFNIWTDGKQYLVYDGQKADKYTLYKLR